MGIEFDFVDRDSYLLPQQLKGVKSEDLQEVGDNSDTKVNAVLEQLKAKYFDAKDKFLLSDQSTFSIRNNTKSNITSKDFKIPSRYLIVDKVDFWGVDIRDPLAVRQLSDSDGVDSDKEVIMTHKVDKGKKDKAIK